MAGLAINRTRTSERATGLTPGTRLSCISHAAMMQRPPKNSAARKPPSEGWDKTTEERGLDTKSPGRVLPDAQHRAENWQGEKLLYRRGTKRLLAYAPQRSPLNQCGIAFQAATLRNQSSCVSAFAPEMRD